MPGRGWLQNDCSQALPVQESKDVSWSDEMADAEQTQEDDPLEKVSVYSGISCVICGCWKFLYAQGGTG